MKVRFIFTLLLSIFLIACSKTNVDPYKSYRKYTSRDIYNLGIKDLANKHYSTASQDFAALNGIYPFGPFSEVGQVDSIYAYYKNGNDADAVAACDRYVRLYPRGNYVYYTYYMQGLVQFKMGLTWLQRWWGTDPALRAMTDKQQSFLAFSQVVQFYPDSIYASDAMAHMHYIRNEIARKELLIAQYYWDRGAYVASANRASAIVQHYQGTPSVIPALALMVNAYRKLGLTTIANNTLAILQANYPDAIKTYKLM